jgi:hypothetical protein
MTDRERQVKRFVLTAIDLCTVCGHAYALDNVDIIGQRDDLWVLRVLCPHCQKQGFIAALVNSQAPDVAPSIDPPASSAALPPLDERHDGAWSPILPVDVLTMHEFLTAFDGDLGAYLNPSFRAGDTVVDRNG